MRSVEESVNARSRTKSRPVFTDPIHLDVKPANLQRGSVIAVLAGVREAVRVVATLKVLCWAISCPRSQVNERRREGVPVRRAQEDDMVSRSLRTGADLRLYSRCSFPGPKSTRTVRKLRPRHVCMPAGRRPSADRSL